MLRGVEKILGAKCWTLKRAQYKCLIIFNNSKYSKIYSYISQLRALGSHTPILVAFFVIHACVSYDCFKLEVHIFLVTLMLMCL